MTERLNAQREGRGLEVTTDTSRPATGAVAEKLALDGGPAVRSAPFPSWPVWDERDERAVLEALRSGKWGAHAGTRVTEFGRRFAELHQAQHAVCVTNGTAALEGPSGRWAWAPWTR